ncbi:hypothetical protein SAMN05216382_1726 [Sphingomonas palmae]|uniref:Uncharacterized protein n=1 Tax=Sphingomonas palmae TaxID=1855283 RepID=A0A1H7NZL8_9SPHN|nr:hypothetical protein [Sphingomonas palmae]SEL29012.1 hypothetical protein SAMN05216382_1726 [Sphingomonas palmae]
MGLVRFVGVCAATVCALSSVSASAQFYLQHKDLSGAAITGTEPDVGMALPGATDAEQRAGVAWNMRAALNVAALQCQFEPTLLTVDKYNALLTDHEDELKSSYDTLTKYFLRTAKTKKEGQQALDQFGTRTYSSFATVNSQFNFCRVAGDIGREALFSPRGQFTRLSLDRMRELRNSLTPWGDQAIVRTGRPLPATLPRFEKMCWKGSDYNVKKCGDPLVPVKYAAR